MTAAETARTDADALAAQLDRLDAGRWAGPEWEWQTDLTGVWCRWRDPETDDDPDDDPDARYSWRYGRTADAVAALARQPATALRIRRGPFAGPPVSFWRWMRLVEILSPAAVALDMRDWAAALTADWPAAAAGPIGRN